MTPNQQHIMTYTMISGIKGSIPLTSQQIQVWMESYRIGTTFITNVGKEYFGLNPKLVADFKVHNEYSEQREHVSAVQPTHANMALDSLSAAYRQHKTLIQVTCKCGASYIKESPYKRLKWSCEKCNNIVFLDQKKGMVDTQKGKAWFMTNKYYVDRNYN
ncbi:hypothetical protein [Paenibacillus terrae]|uniref:Uncharacterized protein n=1 Tax=Paenibacillus terrae TaxID=159743 RepID=A0A0D7WVB2_9BACL|nr:hypothetical protein [Paenibacillus terrae]KJD42658.1 hypothetical protein QD47_26990 [Paenibacillus terrae]